MRVAGRHIDKRVGGRHKIPVQLQAIRVRFEIAASIETAVVPAIFEGATCEKTIAEGIIRSEGHASSVGLVARFESSYILVEALVVGGDEQIDWPDQTPNLSFFDSLTLGT